MKLKKREIGYFITLIILTLLCKQTIINAITAKLDLRVQLNADYLKLAEVLVNVLVGYLGLIKHEVNWIKVAWLCVYGIQLLIIVADKISEYAFGYSVADFDYSLFVSPAFYLVACILPRYAVLGNVNLNRTNAE